MNLDPATPGRTLFPEYTKIHSMFTEEIREVPAEALERTRPEKGWGHWSIRAQASHVASLPYRWLLGRWGAILFGGSLPRDPALAESGQAERMLDPERFPELADILAAMKDSCGMAWEILGRETLASLQEKEISQKTPMAQRRPPQNESLWEWRKNVIMKTHESGVRMDAADPEILHFTLEWTFRHILWEAYAHLKTVQMHKTAEGLPLRVEISEVGYLKTLHWD
ncbi:MAG: hypothetical protein O2807_05905 [bacterium]|nr:hypothetical protein [bacterium]